MLFLCYAFLDDNFFVGRAVGDPGGPDGIAHLSSFVAGADPQHLGIGFTDIGDGVFDVGRAIEQAVVPDNPHLVADNSFDFAGNDIISVVENRDIIGVNMIMFLDAATRIKSAQTHHDVNRIFLIGQLTLMRGGIQETGHIPIPVAGIHTMLMF